MLGGGFKQDIDQRQFLLYYEGSPMYGCEMGDDCCLFALRDSIYILLASSLCKSQPCTLSVLSELLGQRLDRGNTMSLSTSAYMFPQTPRLFYG